MPTYFEAHYQHARRFLEVLRQLSQEYKRSNDDSSQILQTLEQKWGQIVKAFNWSVEASEQEQEAKDICLLFPYVGITILDVWLVPIDFIHWLEKSLKAVQDIKKERKPFEVSNKLGDQFQEYSGKTLGIELDLLLSIGVSYKRMGNYQTALDCYQEAHDVALDLGNTQAKVRILNNQAIVYKQLGDYKKAKYYIEKAWKMVQKPGLDMLMIQGTIAMDFGIVHFHLGNYRKALEFYDIAEKNFLQTGNNQNLNLLKVNKGRVLEQLGETDAAIGENQNALEISVKHGNRRGEAIASLNLGINYYKKRQYQPSIDCQEKTIGIAKELGDNLIEGQGYLNLCQSWRELGDTKRAAEYGQKAYVSLFKDTSQTSVDAREILSELVSDMFSPLEQINFWENLFEATQEPVNINAACQSLERLGLIYHQRGMYEKSTSYYMVLLKKVDVKSPYGINIFNRVGSNYMLQDELEEAISYFERALACARSIDYVQGQIISIAGLSKIFKKQGLVDKALNYLKYIFGLSKKNKDVYYMRWTLHLLGDHYVSVCDYEEAIYRYKQAYELSLETQEPVDQGEDLMMISMAYKLMGDNPKAIIYAEEANELSLLTRDCRLIGAKSWLDDLRSV
jgi:tetratricopeptide (TPR) repeat protein